MARGKFNKRGGGKRIDAQSAEEIEQRNTRLAEFEELRVQRRADAEEEDGGGGGGEGEGEKAKDGKEGKEERKEKAKKKAAEAANLEPDKPEVPVTSAEDHRRNMKKLEMVRKRREVAEKRRKVEEEAELILEEERKAMTAAREAENDDDSDDGGKKKKKSKKKEIDKLTSIEIKKMKPAQMKEALKERDLDIQGNAKALTARLVEYEKAR
jgi:hypothetical protein